MANLQLAKQADYGLLQPDLKLLTEGAIGPANVGPNGADQRIKNYNVGGPYPLVDYNGTVSMTRMVAVRCIASTRCGSSSIAMPLWQRRSRPPTQVDAKTIFFPWEQTASSGGNGGPPPQHEGNIAMGFYNVAKGDMPYFTQLANQ
jgi:phospholipase C